MSRDELRNELVGGCDRAMQTRILWNRLTAEQQKVVTALRKVFAANDAVVDAIVTEVNAGG